MLYFNEPERALLMSSDIVLKVKGISKAFRIYKSPLDRIFHLFNYRNKNISEFQSLENVSFETKKGETVGIVGPNGSGKSTLLQIVAGTMESTSGEVEHTGRVSALLELGSGFNPQFTGAENIYLNGSLYGLSKVEIDHVYNDIVEFSGLGDYIQQPVRNYSSGMYVRLGFAIATSVKPDLLIVDEALAVGDIRFQKKCYRRIDRLKEEGVTILFVSHATEAILNHCDRAIYLKAGKVIKDGSPRSIVNMYLDDVLGTGRLSAKAGEKAVSKEDAWLNKRSYNPYEDRWGDGRAKLQDYTLSVNGVIEPEVIYPKDEILLECNIEYIGEVANPVYGLDIRTVEGIRVFGTNSKLQGCDIESKSKGNSVTVRYKIPMMLTGGDYFISIGVADLNKSGHADPVERRYDMLHIKLFEYEQSYGFSLLDASIMEENNQPMESSTNG